VIGSHSVCLIFLLVYSVFLVYVHLLGPLSFWFMLHTACIFCLTLLCSILLVYLVYAHLGSYSIPYLWFMFHPGYILSFWFIAILAPSCWILWFMSYSFTTHPVVYSVYLVYATSCLCSIWLVFCPEGIFYLSGSSGLCLALLRSILLVLCPILGFILFLTLLCRVVLGYFV